MPRGTIGPMAASSASEYRLLMVTTVPVRIRRVSAFVVQAITGGTTGVTMRVGYAPSGSEIVASTNMTITSLDGLQDFTIANQVVPAGSKVVFKVTASDRLTGQYCIGYEWDEDF